MSAPRVSRLLLLSFFGLLISLGSLSAGWLWLMTGNEEDRLSHLERKRLLLERFIAFHGSDSPASWTPDFTSLVAESLGGRVEVRASHQSLVDQDPKWMLVRGFPGAGDARLVVQLRPPAGMQLRIILGRVLIIAGGAIIPLLIGGAFLGYLRTPSDPTVRISATDQQAEMRILGELARTSAKQQEDLERERIDRVRVEEDLQFRQTLLDRALEEKVRLGHDLHDGVIQSLYAVGLGMEAAKKHVQRESSDVLPLLDGSVASLNTAIRELRSYVIGLTPENLHRKSFHDCIQSLIALFTAASPVRVGVDVDDETASLLDEAQASEILQIVREAMSNSIRHGGASEVKLSLKGTDRLVCVAVQDNGKGITESAVMTTARGMRNMQARAARIGATIRVTSQPGCGVHLALTMALPPLPSS